MSTFQNGSARLNGENAFVEHWPSAWLTAVIATIFRMGTWAGAGGQPEPAEAGPRLQTPEAHGDAAVCARSRLPQVLLVKLL